MRAEMQSLSTIAIRHVADSVPKTYLLPRGLRLFFHIFNRIHLTWKIYRTYKIYKNPDNFISLLSGHALNLTLGRVKCLQIAAQCVLICRRIVDCAYQYKKTALAYRHFKATLLNTYGVPLKQKAPFYYCRYIALRIKYISLAFFQIFVCNFCCVMTLYDAIQAFTFNAATRRERIPELFVNSFACVDYLCQNKENLVDQVKEHGSLLNNIFKSLKVNWTVERFLPKLEQAIQTAEKVDRVTKTVSRDFSKRSLYGLMGAMGVSDLVPDKLVPSIDPPWIEEQKPRERFPTKSIITLKKTK